jgi:glycosyltransferase involved in cell wall biosynthesis
VIPLRIIHVVEPDLAFRWQAGATALLSWQQAQGHGVAIVAVGAGDAPVRAPLLGRRSGAWAWWRRERRQALLAATDWIGDLIHAHGLNCLPVALELGRRLAMPVVVEVARRPEPFVARALRDPRVSGVIVPTEAHRAHALGRLGLDRDRVAAVPPGVDPVRLPQARCVDGSLVVGTWLAPGDVRTAERLAAVIFGLRDGGLAVSALVAGGDGAALASAVHHHGLSGHVRAADDADVLGGCDVVIEIAADERPLHPLLAALAAGRPVVAGALGGIPELVPDGRCGVLVPPGDVAACIQALRQLAEVEHRAAFAAAAIEAARSHHIDLVGEAVLAVYRQAVGGPPGEASNSWRRLTTTRIKPDTRSLDTAPASASSPVEP